MLKETTGPPWQAYIVACTPDEEVLATWETNASKIAGRAFKGVKQLMLNLPIAADILQHRRDIFNERRNLWFIGDIPPPLPPFPPISPDSFLETLPTREEPNGQNHDSRTDECIQAEKSSQTSYQTTLIEEFNHAYRKIMGSINVCAE